MRYILFLYVVCIVYSACSNESPLLKDLPDHSSISLVGNNLCSRMMDFGYFESSALLVNPKKDLKFRYLCDGGNTLGFRPHPARNSPWAFDGANTFYDELTNESGSIGDFPSADEWLKTLNTDIILAFFGWNESFQGKEGIKTFKEELNAFIAHTKEQKYSDRSNTKLLLFSPLAYEDLSEKIDLPDGKVLNEHLAMYTQAMREVCKRESIPFIDLFRPSQQWISQYDAITIDGVQLNHLGYQLLSRYLVKKLFGTEPEVNLDSFDKLRQLILEKNWHWHMDFKMPNGVHAYGRRYEPFGPDNYPWEKQKIKQLTSNRDSAIWAMLKTESFDLENADLNTTEIPTIETNYKLDQDQEQKYLYGDEALKTFTLPYGYKIELFASEKMFPNLANPVQMSFDAKGRLWVSVMPSYPHYKPGDPKPNDKILIYEDTDQDGKADKEIVFAEGLHLPVGFEITHEGVYVSQGTHLKRLIDENKDDQVDRVEITLSGFDDHDTHHVISAFCADPSGAIYMGEGVFLHSNIETSYGPVRGTNGGFFRYNPSKKHLERTAQIPIPNPWGIAFDEWGQNFYLETSGPDMRWMLPASLLPRYGVSNPKSKNLIDEEHKVRPTSGLEFLYSRHFPDEIQGDLLLNNTIGFLGTKQHQFQEDGTGYKTKFRQDLLKSTDPNFRPVDLEIAPDGSLYLVDWHNKLIGHMQHNARDPLRDHEHGRIYRITYPSRPLLKIQNLEKLEISELIKLLEVPENRTKYRVRRELRGRNRQDVLNALEDWIKNSKLRNENFELYKLEALWIQWGLNQINPNLVKELIKSDDHRIRAAAVNAIRYNTDKIPNYFELLKQAAMDEHGRVRLGVIVTASWLEKSEGQEILNIAGKKELDDWMQESYNAAVAHLNGINYEANKSNQIPDHIDPAYVGNYLRGMEIYKRDGFCSSCHQEDGLGLKASNYPPLKDTEWVLGNKERLIKIVLHGIYGPIEVSGESYPGNVPMTPYGQILNDQEIADVLGYVRNAFGNKSDFIDKEEVKVVREKTRNKVGLYLASELQNIEL